MNSFVDCSKPSGRTSHNATSEMSNHFQQRMSWLPQRWRTQRNAIRHANCKIQWVIKTLNATCTSSEVCLLECLFYPHQMVCLDSSWRRLSLPSSSAQIRLRCKTQNEKHVACFVCLAPSSATTIKHVWRKRLRPSLSCRPDLVWLWAVSLCNKQRPYGIGSPIRQDYPLNLSI